MKAVELARTSEGLLAITLKIPSPPLALRPRSRRTSERRTPTDRAVGAWTRFSRRSTTPSTRARGDSEVPERSGYTERLSSAGRLQVCMGVLFSPGSGASKIIGRTKVLTNFSPDLNRGFQPV